MIVFIGLPSVSFVPSYSGGMSTSVGHASLPCGELTLLPLLVTLAPPAVIPQDLGKKNLVSFLLPVHSKRSLHHLSQHSSWERDRSSCFTRCTCLFETGVPGQSHRWDRSKVQRCSLESTNKKSMCVCVCVLYSF